MVVVIFRSRFRPDADLESYGALSAQMDEHAARQPGFISIRTYADSDGERVSVSLFDSDESVARWRSNSSHLEAQRRGREEFYEWYEIRTAAVGRSTEWRRDEQ